MAAVEEDLVSGLDDILAHGLAHDAQSDETYLHIVTSLIKIQNQRRPALTSWSRSPSSWDGVEFFVGR